MAGDWLAQAATIVAQAQGRAAQKRLGAALDAEPRALREAVVAVARRRGVALPDEAADWSGKRLLRLAQAREETARVRSNPIRVDQSFACVACGAAVPPGGGRVRDHCPSCLTGLHVDVVPGDRAANCGARLVAVGLEVVAGEHVLRFACSRCSHTIRVRAHPDDDPGALARLSARAVP